MSGPPHPRPDGAPRNALARHASPFGRMARLPFFLLSLAMIALAIVLLLLMLYLDDLGLRIPDDSLPIPSIVVLIGAGTPLLMRRLHDLGVPGWASPAVIVPRLGWMYALDNLNILTDDDWFAATLLLLLADVLLLLALSAWPGQATANRHGPVPA